MRKQNSLCPIAEAFSTRCIQEQELEACRHALAVLELEKSREKLKAKALALRLSRAEQLLKKAREAGNAQA